MAAFDTLRTVLSPLDYVLIKHPLKRAVDIWSVSLPVVIGAAIVGWLPSTNLFGSAGFVPGVNSLLQILGGFFITSLAAVATFNGAVYRIDDVFEGDVALLRGEPLTRRQFLCHLFAYLALLSIFVYLMGIIGVTGASTLHNTMPPLNRTLIRVGYMTVFSAGLGHIVGTTMVGLVFLSSRLSRVSRRDRFTARPKAPATARSDQ